MRAVFLLAGAVAFTAVACGTDTDADRTRLAELAQGCLINTDCESPLVCAFKRCHTECTDTRDCPTGQRCVPSDRPHNVCLFEDETECIYHTDCPAEHLFCAKDRSCREQCKSFRDCVAGQVCTEGACADKEELGGDGKLPDPDPSPDAGIGRTCVYDSECKPPLVCKQGTCLPECRGDRDCQPGARCEQQQCVGAGMDGGTDGNVTVPACRNGKQDPGETKIDCGGFCGACDGEPCKRPSDCASAVCVSLVCQGASCTDGLQNGNESDRDCGGDCPKCLPQQGCWNTTDCVTGSCVGGTCTAPSCMNTVQDTNETDVDCGGSECDPCADGRACAVNTDCSSQNCVDKKCVPAGPTAWVKLISALTTPPHVEVDPQGDIIVAGTFFGTIDLGNGSVTAAASDWFIAKYTAAGAHIWSRTYGGSSHETLDDIAIDAQGNVVVVGKVSVGGSVGGTPLTCDNATITAKYSGGNGAHIWSVCPDGPNGATNAGATVAVTPNGDVITAGVFYGTIDFGVKIVTNPWNRGYVVRYGAQTGIATQLFDLEEKTVASRLVDPTALAADADHFYIAGDLSGTIEWGNGVTTVANTSNDVFITKLKHDGTPVDTRSFGASGSERVFEMRNVGPDLVLAGAFQSQVDFGANEVHNSKGKDDIFLMRVKGADLSTVWAKAFGSPENDGPVGLAVSPAGEIAIAGSMSGPINFGGGPVKYDNQIDLFVARFSLANAAHQFSGGWGTFSADKGGHAALVGKSLVFTGTYSSSGIIDLGTGPLPPKQNGFAAMFP